jgi:hypothetical protein
MNVRIWAESMAQVRVYSCALVNVLVNLRVSEKRIVS